jgi:hypothetical protein
MVAMKAQYQFIQSHRAKKPPRRRGGNAMDDSRRFFYKTPLLQKTAPRDPSIGPYEHDSGMLSFFQANAIELQIAAATP